MSGIKLAEGANQKNTILNLYNSGIDPEIISLELDIDEAIVKDIIEKEKNKQVRNSKSNLSSYLMNKFYLDAIIDVSAIIKESQIRTWNALKSKPELNIIVKETQSILEQYAESKLKLVMLHIDLVGSTKMSLTLPIDRLTTIIRVFAQEMTKIIAMYGGYVLKYIGDAVLAFFVVEDIENKEQSAENDKTTEEKTEKFKTNSNSFASLQFSNVISCASTMIKVIKEGINPILNQYDYPELKVRVGMDYGEVAIVQYGIDIYEFEKTTLKMPHLDLIGYTISVAVKMTSLAEPDHMVIGQKLFSHLEGNLKGSFRKLNTNTEIWSYSNNTNDGLYNIFMN
ncbi:MAG: adenylate/guanylate cyclase domain-containing protein [Thermoproteota archaeon]|nr:adenylate/guanylate cyclase domain-containing protein [Thermoproteota archaeon]